MVGTTGSLITMRLVRSKLRKREETSSASTATLEAQTTFARAQNSHQWDNQPSGSITASIIDANVNEQHLLHGDSNDDATTTSIDFAQTSKPWIFPPLPPQPNIYNCTNNIDALIHSEDRHGFKGFRKQFSGRFKRLVAKKPQEPSPAIPPELKPQLKTIYVY